VVFVINTSETNYTITQGDSFILPISYTDSNNNPIDLTGYTAKIEVRDKPGGKIVCAVGTIGNGITISTPTNGEILINLTPTMTKNFVLPRSAYQVQITSSDQTATTILSGWFIVNPGVIQ
jgi:hypothetical protein